MERMSPQGKAGVVRRGTRAVVAASVLALSSMALVPAVAQAEVNWENSSTDIQNDPESYPRLSALINKIESTTIVSADKNVPEYNTPNKWNEQVAASHLVRARAMNLAPDGVTAPKTDTKNRVSDPLIINNSSYQDWQSDRNIILDVYSASMQRTIPMHVMLPADPDVASPVLYLLNGAGGGEDAANWSARTDIQSFLKDENVYVVTPLEGMFSYYTDWQQPVEELHGYNKWTTFLTEELPSIMNQTFDTNGKNGLAGLSMSGSAVLSLAEWASDNGSEANGGTPGGNLYNAVGGYSGCAATSTFPGQQYVEVVTGMRGGIDVEDMWGPKGGPDWVANDAAVNAEKLKGIDYVYVATGSGLPGEHDTLANPELEGNQFALANQIVVGGVIEAATNMCTHDLANRTNAMGMTNITYNFKPTGTHSWGYWQDDLHDSWGGMAAAMQVPPRN
ncbi:hypothetical protein GCM10023353_30600 [Tomitella cavernea]|uniref:Uncharacterized protein n=2 Tax=Tomitella cavernea TaxID=1387982 RepID=A0ABP9D2B2_9ACTN